MTICICINDCANCLVAAECLAEPINEDPTPLFDEQDYSERICQQTGLVCREEKRHCDTCDIPEMVL